MSDALEAAQHGTEILLGLGTTLVVVTAIFVAIRLFWDTKSSRKFHADDYLAICAIIFLAASHGIFYEFLKAYVGGTASFYTTAQLIVAQAIISGFATWFAKAPILALYLRLFGVQFWVRFVCWFVLVATGLAYFIAISYNAAGCTPHSLDVDAQFVIDCTHLSSIIGLSLGGIAVATDTIIFVIPIPIIFRLHLSIQKKIGLALIFFTGSLGIVASAVALSFKVDSLSGTSTDVSTAVILTVVELSIAIIVGCAPAARSFWIDIVEGNALYTTLASWVSQVSFRFTTRGSVSTATEATSDYPVTKNGKTNIHPYATIKDNASSKSGGRQTSSEMPLVEMERRA